MYGSADNYARILLEESGKHLNMVVIPHST